MNAANQAAFIGAMRTIPKSSAWRQDRMGTWWRPGTEYDEYVIWCDAADDGNGYVIAGSAKEADEIDQRAFGRPAPTLAESILVAGADLAKLVFVLVFPALAAVALMGVRELVA